MTDEQFHLANAYIDDALTADERRSVEADPMMMAEVTKLESVRAALGEPRSDPVRRERDVAAALVEFAAIHDTVPHLSEFDPTPTGGQVRPTVSESAPSQAPRRWSSVAIAAGVIAIGVCGFVLVQLAGNSASDDSADRAGTSALRSVTVMAAEGDSTAVSAQASATTTAASIDVSADSAIGSTSGDTGTDLADPTGASADEAEADTNVSGPIDTPTELAAVGAQLYAADQAGTLGITPETRCQVVEPVSGDRYLVLGNADVNIDGTVTAALIGYVDTQPIGFVALDPDDCSVLINATEADLS